MTKKQKKMLKRIIISAVLFACALIVPNTTAKNIVFFVSYIIAGYDIVLKSLRNISHLQFFDENFLMLIASIGAFAIGEFPEAVAISLFYQIGELFQSYAVGKSRKSIKELMNIKPDYANIEKDGVITKVDPETVRIDDIIIVNSGEKIPLDGIVISGTASVDTSAMTGESLPVTANLGSKVTSGSIALDGMLKIRVTSEFSDSTVSKVLRLVTEASEKKSKSENYITKFSKYYTPIVVITAAILGIFVPIFFPVNTAEWVKKALVFLVVSCPCALIISVPLSFFGGIGAASKNGILIKGSQYIEALSKADTVIFDKTGTLTKGNYSVTEIYSESYDENELLEIATLCEAYSNHPIAVALKKDSTVNKSINNFKEISGKGVTAEIDGKNVAVGNKKLMQELNIQYNDIENAGAVVYVAIDGKYEGHIIVNDEIKKESKAAVSLLKKCGIRKTVLLTGDKKIIGEAVGNEVGIDETHCELLPQDKVKYAEKLKALMPQKKTLIFAGDGINDAPTLAFSDVGIAMGAMGSDAAIEAADVVIMDDNPKRIAMAVMLSKRTMNIAVSNIVISLAVKFFFLIMGALGYAGLWGAVFADVGVMIIAIINAFRTLKFKFPKSVTKP